MASSTTSMRATKQHSQKNSFLQYHDDTTEAAKQVLSSLYNLKCGGCKSNEFQAGKFLSEGVYPVLYFFELRFGNISVPFLILPHKRIVNAEITRKRTHVNHVVIFK